MNVDTFLIRLVLLVIPGLAGYKTFRTIQSTGKSRKQIKDWQDLLAIVFISVLSYGLLYLVYLLIVAFGKLFRPQSLQLSLSSIDALVNAQVSLDFFEIIYSSLIAMTVGLASGVLYNRKILFRIARSLKITKNYGDDDVWSYVMNSDDVEWLFVRDHIKELIYFGRIALFSESDEKRELLLEDVDVYSNADGMKLYHTDSLYLCRADNELTLEIPNQRAYIDARQEGQPHGGSNKRNAEHSRRNRKERWGEARGKSQA
jgi:hypothetical protein